MVTDGAVRDSKDLGSMYEDFGNWHYGYIGMEVGLSPDILLRAAGLNQATKPSYRKQDGTFIDLYEGSSYGDYPRDQIMIRRGIRAWQRYH